MKELNNAYSQIPDLVDCGEYKNRAWCIRRGVYGPCGYVLLSPAEEEEFASIYDEWDIPVPMHGECTYKGDLLTNLGTWIGFDTNHVFDNEKTQNVSFCKKECERIIDFLLERQNAL